VIVEGEGAVLGVSLECSMVTNGEFGGWLCESGFMGGVAAWGGGLGSSGIGVGGGGRPLSVRGSFCGL